MKFSPKTVRNKKQKLFKPKVVKNFTVIKTIHTASDIGYKRQGRSDGTSYYNPFSSCKVCFPSQMATPKFNTLRVFIHFFIYFNLSNYVTLHLSFQYIVSLQIKYTLPSTRVDTARSASSWTPLDLPLELLSICRSAVMIGSEICGASAGVTLRNTLWNKTVTLNFPVCSP